MYIFNYERVQAKYRILENGKNNIHYITDIKKLIKIESIYYNIYKFLESEQALLHLKQYNNIWKYYNIIKKNIKSKVKELETKKAKEVYKNV